MDNNGPLLKLENASSSLPSPSLLEKIEQQKIFWELHISTPKLGDIWIHVEIGAKACCVQFYKLKLDHKIRIRNRHIRIVFLGKESHLFC
jgi:hypothetical protein